MREKRNIRFDVSPSSGVPIYRQIMDQVGTLISSGKLKPGDLLPSVRDVAGRLQINPMTVSKAYSKLQDAGVVELQRGQGIRILAGEPVGTVRQRQAQLKPLAEQLLAKAHQLNLTREQIQAVLDPLIKGIDDE